MTTQTAAILRCTCQQCRAVSEYLAATIVEARKAAEADGWSTMGRICRECRERAWRRVLK
jgi:hypothetical protein